MRKRSHPIRPEDSFTLPEMAGCDDDRATLNMLEQAAELTAQMHRALPDISRKAGEMERSSPLFFGTGLNPSLF